MTRETKIGLLVGLGFIVVFAMLLSHSAPTPPPGDSLQLASAGTQARPEVMSDGPGGLSITPDAGVDIPGANSAAIESPVPIIVEAPTESVDDIAPGLPTPAAFESAQADATPPIEAPPVVVEAPIEPTPTTDVLEMTRVAPPLPEPVAPPAPTAREGTPQESPPPNEPAPAAAPPTPNATPKEYIVQKGDTLGEIAKSIYGTGSAKVIEFLTRANKERIKNKNVVAEGQKLIVPQLPPDMFEPVAGLNLTKSEVQKAQDIDQLINDRRAPIAPKDVNSDKPSGITTTKPVKEMIRVYEVQAKETFSSIARDQLGSERHWREIQRLNKGVDPTKMRPGTKLRLPARRPLSDASRSGRSSA